MNRPANTFDKCIFNIFDFTILFPTMGFFSLCEDAFRQRRGLLFVQTSRSQRPSLSLSAWLCGILTQPIESFTFFLKLDISGCWFWHGPHGCLRFSRNLKALIPTYTSSPLIFGVSPKLAVMVHGAGKWAEDLKIPSWCVFDLFPTPKNKFLSSYFLLRLWLLDIIFFIPTRI